MPRITNLLLGPRFYNKDVNKMQQSMQMVLPGLAHRECTLD